MADYRPSVSGIEGVPLRGRVDSDGVQTATFSNESIERTLFTLNVPGNTIQIGDLLRLEFLTEFLPSPGSGNYTGRIRVGGSEIIADGPQFMPGSQRIVPVVGLDDIAVVDTGGGAAAARLVEQHATSVDFVLDLTADSVWTFTQQMSIADPGNAYRGILASLSIY